MYSGEICKPDYDNLSHIDVNLLGPYIPIHHQTNKKSTLSPTCFILSFVLSALLHLHPLAAAAHYYQTSFPPSMPPCRNPVGDSMRRRRRECFSSGALRTRLSFRGPLDNRMCVLAARLMLLGVPCMIMGPGVAREIEKCPMGGV